VKVSKSAEHGNQSPGQGTKHDAGKPRLAVVLRKFKRALAQVALADEQGDAEYGPDNWERVPNGVNRYSDSMVRHAAEGRGIDPKSKLLHATHAAWDALAVLELMLREADEPTSKAR
jgi:hypothetical protein